MKKILFLVMLAAILFAPALFSDPVRNDTEKIDLAAACGDQVFTVSKTIENDFNPLVPESRALAAANYFSLSGQAESISFYFKPVGINQYKPMYNGGEIAVFGVGKQADGKQYMDVAYWMDGGYHLNFPL